MSNYAIKVTNLGKQYTIGAAQARYKSLRDSLSQAVRAPFQRLLSGSAAREDRSIWALKDVSFEIKPGEVVGVIGRNGAGKSTLLKLLARITEPTTGEICLRGRVGSLLEVGTGFHPELTGRENIFLNGAILGMSRVEIARKFDEIVAFSEIEQFIDTPAKHLSSGMYMRLAFAVAAHLEPEILLVDEVLAVGDAQFQKKCLGKMENVVEQGRTVLFVSHNLVAVTQICKKCMWIDFGKIRDFDDTAQVISKYSQSFSENRHGKFDSSQIKGDGRVTLLSYVVTNENEEPSVLPITNEDVLITVKVNVFEEIKQPAIGISIFSETGVSLTSINTVEQGKSLKPIPKGTVDILIRLKDVPYLPGRYLACFWVMNPQTHIYVYAENAISFEIGQSPLYGVSQIDYRWGCVFTDIDFLINEKGVAL